MAEPTSGYQAYVLRLWQEMPHRTWRAVVQPVPNGEWLAFNSLDSLFAYLYQMTANDTPQPTNQPNSEVNR
ncbi:MAG: hypothetical protein IPM39_22165 [Chloroflexi bacterium]|nr:hypothetical protein [Chloroflexota bacterium]